MTYIKPVDVLVPVRPCDGRVGDVWLLRVVLGVAVRLRGARHGRRLLDVLGVDGLHAGGRLVGRHAEAVVRWRAIARGVVVAGREVTSRSREELRSDFRDVN